VKKYFLKLNSSKTEVLVIVPPSVSSSLTPQSFDICGSSVSISESVRDLGVLYDDKLNMQHHVKSVCAKAYYQIHLISKVRKYISEDAARTLVHANVTSRLDYCNSLLIGLPENLLDQLQRVQNRAARLIKGSRSSDHITPVLKELHWLPIRFRIRYKLILLTFKCLNDCAPFYLSDLITPYVPNRQLRSQNQNLLKTMTYRRKHYGARSFVYQAPLLWNSLPISLRTCTSFYSFKKLLKTYLFTLAFNAL
jgi:hypothetical protein